MLLCCVSFAGETLIKLDTFDPNEDFGRHGLGKLSELLHSKQHSGVEKPQNTGTKMLQSGEQQGTVIKNAVNFSNEIVPMERVRCLCSVTVTSHNANFNVPCLKICCNTK
jgi:hypothetical protein